MLIFSLTDSFVEIRDCTPLYADSFGLNACHSQVSFAGIRYRSQVLGIVRSYYVGVVRRYAPPFSTFRIRSTARPFQNLWTPVPVCLGRPFVHLWTPVRAFVGCPYLYLCVRALGGNFIMTCTVALAVFLVCAATGFSVNLCVGARLLQYILTGLLLLSAWQDSQCKQIVLEHILGTEDCRSSLQR